MEILNLKKKSAIIRCNLPEESDILMTESSEIMELYPATLSSFPLQLMNNEPWAGINILPKEK
jgi:hypothetical protein